MKHTDKSKDQLVWDLKKLEQQTELTIQAKDQELEQLNKVLETVTTTLNLDDVVEKVMNALSDTFSFNQISIHLFNSDDNTLDLNYSYGNQASTELFNKFKNFPLSIEWDDAYLIKSFLDNETLYISHITEKMLEHFSDRDRILFEWNPHKSIIIVPLQVQEKVIGVISFINILERFQLNDKDIQKIESYVAQIATTINNAYLVRKTQHALKKAQEKEKEVQHLNTVIQATNSTLNFDDVFEAILTGLKDVFDFEAIGIQLVDEGNNLLNIYKVYGEMIEPHHIDRWRKIQISSEGDASVSSYVFAKGEIALFPKITPDMPFSSVDLQVFRVMAFSGYFAFPLIVRGQKIGVISFFRTERPFELNDQKISKISNYVATLSSAIKNTKTFNELQNAYNKVDSLLEASLKFYSLKSMGEMAEFTVEQLILTFPNISLGLIFKNTLNNEDVTIYHNIHDEEQTIFTRYFDKVIDLSTKKDESVFLSRLDQLLDTRVQQNRKENWKIYSLHSSENIVFGKLVLKGVNLKAKDENILKLCIHQITSALVNSALINQLNEL